jgi:hypothetical protein
MQPERLLSMTLWQRADLGIQIALKHGLCRYGLACLLLECACLTGEVRLVWKLCRVRHLRLLLHDSLHSNVLLYPASVPLARWQARRVVVVCVGCWLVVYQHVTSAFQVSVAVWLFAVLVRDRGALSSLNECFAACWFAPALAV